MIVETPELRDNLSSRDSDPPTLTKDLYVRAAHCDRYLWLKRHKPREEAPASEGAKQRMDVGRDIGAMARGLYPNGVFVLGRNGETSGEATARLLEEGHDVLFEATLQFGRFTARIDILKRSGFGYEIQEVKSSKSKLDDEADSEHVKDVAYQVWVARNAGLEVERSSLLLLNRHFVRGGAEPSLSELFTIVDITEKVERKILGVEKEATRMLAVIDGEDPQPEFVKKCRECGYVHGCFPKFDVFDIALLPNTNSTRARKLRSEGILRIGDLPESSVEEGRQIRARQSAITGAPVVLGALRSALSRIRFPLVCVDFEAIQYAIPRHGGMTPYQVLPFQWSAHVLDSLDSDPVHQEFLHQSNTDPRREFAESLFHAVRDAKSVLVYSSYEQANVRKLHEHMIEGAERLVGIFSDPETTIDLLDLVRENVYVPDFAGSFSIKAVLPALVPDLGYGDLVIKDGDSAAAAYLDLLDWLGTPTGELLAQDLLAYCERDTLAMVEVLRALFRLSENPTH